MCAVPNYLNDEMTCDIGGSHNDSFPYVSVRDLSNYQTD